LRSSFRAATSSIKACLFGMRRVEALGREALDQPSRFGTRERRAVKVEVILDDQDDLDTREADIGQLLQDVGVIERRSPWPLETPSIGLGAHALLQRNRPSLQVPAKKWGAYCTGRPRIWCCGDHSAGRAVRRVMPILWGSRPSMAALTRSGARKASEIIIFTFRTLQFSRCAMRSAVVVASAISSSSHRRPRAMAATKVARVSERIGRAW